MVPYEPDWLFKYYCLKINWGRIKFQSRFSLQSFCILLQSFVSPYSPLCLLTVLCVLSQSKEISLQSMGSNFSPFGSHCSPSKSPCSPSLSPCSPSLSPCSPKKTSPCFWNLFTVNQDLFTVSQDLFSDQFTTFQHRHKP